jgi:8-oxo-dGTP diphosphatase
MAIGRFQCGIAAIIYHPPTKTYLLLQRSSSRDAGQGEWECVTGRVDQGESFERALHREVHEELGVTVSIDFIVGTTHFYRGEQIPENELLGVKYACTIGDRDAVQVGSEHQAHQWLSADEVYNLLPTEHWLHQAIRRTELLRQTLPAALIALFQQEGF